MAAKKAAAEAPLQRGTIPHTLAVIANGGKLTRERADPYPSKFWLRWTEDGKPQSYTLSDSHIVRLLSDKLVKPNAADVQQNPGCIRYFITERGLERVGERAA